VAVNPNAYIPFEKELIWIASEYHLPDKLVASWIWAVGKAFGFRS
jgi:hypothetical protein